MSLTNEQIDGIADRAWNLLEPTPDEMNQLAAQAKEANALRADAERYRWLRGWDTAINNDNSPWCIAWQDADKKISAPEYGEYLDALVDKAIAARTPTAQG